MRVGRYQDLIKKALIVNTVRAFFISWDFIGLCCVVLFMKDKHVRGGRYQDLIKKALIVNTVRAFSVSQKSHRITMG